MSTARPMWNETRVVIYYAQSGRDELTARQRRRAAKKRKQGEARMRRAAEVPS